MDSQTIKLITNNNDNIDVLYVLKELFSECKSFYLSVAFISYSGLQLLLTSLKECEERNVKGKILTSDYLNFTDPKSLKKLISFNNIESKIFCSSNNNIGFHTKGYIFECACEYKILIGSSNITQSAVKSNIEWNLEVISKKDSDIVKAILEEFNSLMENSQSITDDYIDKYNKFFNKIRNYTNKEKFKYEENNIIIPNDFQQDVVYKLKDFRKNKIIKALLIASTGVGKTYASAFDVLDYLPNKLLYIVHNENILDESLNSFKKIIKNKTFGLLVGGKKETDKDYIFASIQSLISMETYKSFDPKYFDYIIYDEAHRAYSPSGQMVLNYFKPKFLLGMTATPERSDSGNIFKIFDYNIASNVRLEEALERNLLVPFHYFGIRDNIDLSKLNLDNIDEIATRLSVEARVSLIIEKMEFYGFNGKKRKCLGFCANIKHAKYMAEMFNLVGYNAVALSGEDGALKRKEYIERLQRDSDKLEFIFTVDIFNEGVDIPYVNLILMLRPTQSIIVFTQQLGRGLRKANNKEFLTVLDFISNYKRSFLIAMALSGRKIYDKDTVKTRLKTNFSNLKGCTNIEMDPISKEEIFKQLDNTNFNKFEFLKKSYLEYSKECNKKILKLSDFIKDENAPDPITYIEHSEFANKQVHHNYLLFLNHVFKNNKYNLNENELLLIDYISSFLPLVRIDEFIALKSILQVGYITYDEFKHDLKSIIYEISNITMHSFETLSGEYMDSSEKSKYSDFFILNKNELRASNKFLDAISNKVVKDYLDDLIDYGISRYIIEYGVYDYGKPFLKLYNQYKMRDLALASNYTKTHSSIRGQGVWHDLNNNYYLFAEINKLDNIKESINYEDYFESLDIFNWQSPNATIQDSKEGRIFTNKNSNIYLFVRKEKKIDSKTQKFIYVGKVTPISYYGNKPITIKYKLENKLPKYIFEDMKKIKGE